jgi:hypothetical protein
MEVSGQINVSAALTPEKETQTHWIEGWVGLRTRLANYNMELKSNQI